MARDDGALPLIHLNTNTAFQFLCRLYILREFNCLNKGLEWAK